MYMLVSHLTLIHVFLYGSPLILYLTRPLYKQMTSKQCVEYLIDQRVNKCLHKIECEMEDYNTIIYLMCG